MKAPRPCLIGLVNEVLNGSYAEAGIEASSISLVEKPQWKSLVPKLVVEYNRVITISIVGQFDDREFVVSGSDCTNCDGSHVDCQHVEQTTKDYDEVLEMAESMYQEYYR